MSEILDNNRSGIPTGDLDAEIDALLARADEARREHRVSGPLRARAVALRTEQIRSENESADHVGQLLHRLHADVDTLDEWRGRFRYADLILKEAVTVALIASKLAAIAEDLQIATGNGRNRS